jgi:hypothetical protein
MPFVARPYGLGPCPFRPPGYAGLRVAAVVALVVAVLVLVAMLAEIVALVVVVVVARHSPGFLVGGASSRLSGS